MMCLLAGEKLIIVNDEARKLIQISWLNVMFCNTQAKLDP